MLKVPRVLMVLMLKVLQVLQVLMVLSVPKVLSAQGAPPRDGLIRGQVVDATSGRPVSAVLVSLTGSGLPSPSAGRGATVVVPAAPRILTGSDGRFAFPDLQAGRFTIAAAKSGYADGASGRRRPGGTTQPVTLTDAQRTADVVVRIWKLGAIGGTVTDEAGEPVVGLQVRALAETLTRGRRRFNSVGGTVTDDRGAYRVTGLAPGDYKIVASPPLVSISVAAMNDALRTKGGAGDGAELAAAIGAGRGVQIGDALISVGRGIAVPPPPVNGRLQVYPPTYHPSTPAPAQSPLITVGAGEDRSGIDIQLQPVTTARVSGSVIFPSGTPSMAVVRLVPFSGGELDYGGYAPLTATDIQGVFVFPAVVPGQYKLQTSARQGGEGLWADVPIAVGGDQEVAVTLSPGLSIAGRIEYDGNAARPERAVPVLAEAIDGQGASTLPGAAAPSSSATDFTLRGHVGGRYLLRIPASPAGWMFKSAMLNGVDVSETPFELSRDVSDVVVTFTDRWTGLSGVVQGAGAAGASIVVFPTDVQSWSSVASNPRRLKSARADAQGRFGISSLPPGDYFVAAIPDEDSAEWRDPKNLDALARSATRVSIGDGEHRTIDLRLREGRQ